MMIIIGATDLELKNLKKIYPNVYILGIGIANTAYNLTKLIYENKKRIKKVIMLGIGGGFKDKVNLLDVCIATEEINGDFGICKGDRIEYFDENKIILNSKLDIDGIKKGKFITVNCVTTDKSIIKFYENNFSPVCENMEGYAAALICKKEKIEFQEIRVISNFVGDRKNWKIKEAVDILYETGKEIIKILS